MALARTPEPPYVAVLFTTERAAEEGNDEGYEATDDALFDLVHRQPGFLGVESVANGHLGITVSYWESEDDARGWKLVAEHQVAQRLGRERWFRAYRVRVARVERDYGFERGTA